MQTYDAVHRGRTPRARWRRQNSRNINAAAFALACAICGATGTRAQETSTHQPSAAATSGADTNPTVRLPEVVVQGRSDSLVGMAESASQGTVGARQLDERPILRPGELLETVPGLIVTQHSGDGKANQYFLRGFNLDHGTDFATKVNGVPVNLPTHAHGQGYTDLNFMIPELVRTVNYKKGVYYADEGDFSSAGAANLQYFNVLPQGIALATVGMYDYYRGLVADSPKVGEGNLLYAGEIQFNNGPWDHPAGFLKGNAVLGYSMGNDQNGWSVTGMAYAAEWDSTDQIPSRAVRDGSLDRFGSLNTSDGGNSQRYSFSGEWHRAGDNSMTRVMAYGYYYELDLFSDFTYFLDDPVNGDQFEQQDSRWVSGAQASHSWLLKLGEIELDNTVGLQIRNDAINNGLYHTARRDRLSVTRRDHVVETSISPYAETREQWTDWFRSIAGVRLDIFNFDVRSSLSDSSGNVTDAIANPKLALIFGPWARTEFYLNGGMGFHSNDGRGTTAPVDPVDPLVRTYGAEVGARTTWLPNLQSTLAFWWLQIDSELLFIGDAGTTEASRPSKRYGVEWANYYIPAKWLTLDADFAFTHARFSDNDPAGNSIPGSPDTIIAAGVTVHDLNGFFGSLRLRFFGPRPFDESDNISSDPTLLLSAQVGYQFNKTWSISAEVFNLLNREDSDITYYYPSRLPGEPAGGVEDVHFHPVEPISVRVSLMARF